MAKILFEWVLKDKDGEIYILTERQYQFYKDNQDEKMVGFVEFGLNPSYIVSSRRRPAENLKGMYPCNDCMTNGYLIKAPRNDDGTFQECPACEGTGVKLP